MIVCKRCGSQNHYKAGVIKGEQRYKCKECTHQFIPNRERGRPEKDKLLAVTLYVHGLSYRAIAKICKASPRAVFEWVKKYAQKNYAKPEPRKEVSVVELDEMWHYLHKKKEKSGYGRLIVVLPINLSTGNVEGEMKVHLEDCMKD